MLRHALPAVLLALSIALTATAVTFGLHQSGRHAAGLVLDTIALPALPLTAAFDSQHGRLYVLNQSLEQGAATAGSGFSSVGGAGEAATTLSIIDTRASMVMRRVATHADPKAIAINPHDGLIYLSSDQDDTARVLDAQTGIPLRAAWLGVWSNALAVDTRTNRLFVVNTIAGSVSMLTARRTRLLRTIDLITAVRFYNIAVDARRGRVFIGAANWVSMLDARSGDLLQMVNLGSPGTQSQEQPAAQLAVDDAQGRVFALEPGSVSVLDAGTGKVMRKIRVGADAALALDARREHLLIAGAAPVDSAGLSHGAGQLQVVNLKNGAVLRAIPLGLAPCAVFIDQQADRVLVLDRGGLQAVRDPLAWLPNSVRASLPYLSAPGLHARQVQGSIAVLDLKRL
jgi:DNA-binding beta-propeller fold protein YncE